MYTVVNNLENLLDQWVERSLLGTVAEWLLMTELTWDIAITYKCKRENYCY